MESLREIFSAMEATDQEKVASAEHEEASGFDEELIKQAQNYDQIGRVLAHHAFADMVKQAVDEDEEASEDEKKKRFKKMMRKARGEKSDEDEDEDKKKSKEDKEKDEEGEKKASAMKGAILERMANDPEYLQYLMNKHLG